MNITCDQPEQRTKPEIPRTCWGCGKDIRGTGKQKWCSTDCSGHDMRWIESHKFWAAKPAALKAAGFTRKAFPDSVDTSGYEIKWSEFRAYILWECRRCHSLTDKPEVNHIIPWTDVTATPNRIPSKYRRSDRGDVSCKNHQSNLEVLDHYCHGIETKAQAQGRAAARKGTRPQLPLVTS